MNTHLNDGQLRAALDGELNAADLAHLQGCQSCQQRESAINAQTQRVAAFFVPAAQRSEPDAHKALRRFHLKRTQKEIPMFKKLFASSIFRYAAIAVLLIVVTASFPETRALASQFLSLFRVQQVQVVFLDFTGMKELTGQGTIGEQMSQLLSSSMTVTKQSTRPVDAADAAEASQLAGFAVRLPQDKTPADIRVMNASAFSFKIDHGKAQALLDETGSDLILPASIDGKDVSINIPAGVSATYGTCPSHEDNNVEQTGRRYADCILFAQIPSPTVSAPADLDIAQLAQVGLEFSGMNHEEAAAFTRSVDWTSTLVIPLPSNAASYEDISIDGVAGKFIQRPADEGSQFALIWVKDGIIYAMSGLARNSEQAIQMANALP